MHIITFICRAADGRDYNVTANVVEHVRGTSAIHGRATQLLTGEVIELPDISTDFGDLEAALRVALDGETMPSKWR